MKHEITVEVFEDGTELRLYTREGNVFRVIPLWAKEARKISDLLEEIGAYDEDIKVGRVKLNFDTAEESIAYLREKRAKTKDRLRQMLESALEELDEEADDMEKWGSGRGAVR